MKVTSKSDSTGGPLSIQARLASAIRMQRSRLGVTQEELAWRADMHRTYIADIERGSRNITLRSIVNLAKALEVSVASLLSVASEESSVPPLEAGPGATLEIPLGEILLVEDNATDEELTLRAFKRVKFANPVKVVRDGEEALDYLFRRGRYEKVASNRPHLVLLDLKLPGISGIEVLRQMKEDKLLEAIPVVMLTGSQEDRDVIECGRLGAKNYIIKPVDFEAFSRITPKLNFHWVLSQPASGRPKTQTG